MASEEAVRRYLEGTVLESDALRRVREASEAAGLPRLDRASARLLAVLARAVARDGRVLELGAALGHSALALAEAVGPEGSVDTIEMDPDLAAGARARLREAGVAGRVRVLVGRALEILPGLEPGYDLAFLDADKREYAAYLDHALRLVRPGGLVVADNVLWSGKVADPAARDADTEGLRTYTRRALADPRLETTLVPVGDGLAVSVVKPGPSTAGR